MLVDRPQLCNSIILGAHSHDALEIRRQRPGLLLLSDEDIVRLVM